MLFREKNTSHAGEHNSDFQSIETNFWSLRHLSNHQILVHTPSFEPNIWYISLAISIACLFLEQIKALHFVVRLKTRIGMKNIFTLCSQDVLTETQEITFRFLRELKKERKSGIVFKINLGYPNSIRLVKILYELCSLSTVLRDQTDQQWRLLTRMLKPREINSFLYEKRKW